MIVQIYEIRNPEEGRQVAALGVDHIGVLFGKGEPEYALDAPEIKAIFDALPKRAKKVVLVLRWRESEVEELLEKTRPDILHIGTSPGYPTPEEMKGFKKRHAGLLIMRTIPVTDIGSVNLAKAYEGIADFILLDSKKQNSNQIGATGETHDWNISRQLVESVQVPIILAGGLGPENVAEAVLKVKPAGVDSKTKTDTADGWRKDLLKVKRFVSNANLGVQ